MADLDTRCAVCGEDCGDRPHTRDRRGRVFCTACQEAARRPAGVEPVPLEPVTAAAADPPSARWQLWPFYLYFRPRLFFRSFTSETASGVIAIFAWIFGVAGVIDRVETRTAARAITGQSGPVPNDWAVHWATYLIGGILGGAVYYGIGGWWYRVRLRFSGAVDPDPRLARRVFILASLVVAFPSILAKLVETVRFATPLDAVRSDFSILDGVVLLSIFWSVWASFVGVRTVFDTRRVRAIVWFLVLPAAGYGVAFAGVVVAMLLAPAGPADVAHPQSMASNTFRFDYPGNWWIDTEDPGYDPDASLTVEPWQDAIVVIMVYESESSPAEELDDSLDWLGTGADNVTLGAPVTRYGVYEGIGRSLTAEYNAAPTTVRLFVADLGDGRFLEVQEFCVNTDLPDVQEGFRQIEMSLSVQTR